MKNSLLFSIHLLIIVCSSVSAESWPVYYQPIVEGGTPTPTPVVYKAMLTGGYGDWRSQSEYKEYHTGIDFGVNISPGSPTPATDYMVYPVVPGKVVRIKNRDNYNSRIDILSGNLTYSYGHLLVDSNLHKDDYVALSTPLGRVYHHNDPGSHLHLALFDSNDMDAPIQNLLDYFNTGFLPCSNPQIIFNPSDPYSGITFFSDDAQGSIEHLEKVVSGKVDILAHVHQYAQGSNDPLGVQWIGYRIYQGMLPDSDNPKEPVYEGVLLNSKTFNGSVNGRDYRPCDYDKYPTPLPPVDADVIYALDNDYTVYVDSVRRIYGSIDDFYNGLQFVYIVTNNADPTPTRGNPEYLSKSGCWDTTELNNNGCPKFPTGVYTVVIEAHDYSGNKKTNDADSHKAVWVDSGTKGSGSSSTFYLVDGNNVSGPWDGSFEHPFRTITDAIDAQPPADYIHVSPGVYEDETFPIEMRSGLTLHGESPHNTIIRIPSPSGLDLVHFDGVIGTTLENFQLIGGYNCINVTNGADPLIQNNVIRDSNAPTNVGGGIQVTNSNPDIFNNLILDNKIYGIFCQGSAATIMNNTIAGHNYVYAYPDDFPSYNGKGIFLYLDVPGTLIIRNNIITDNYYGVLKCATTENNEHSSFNDVGVNSHGQYWAVWPAIATPGSYVRDCPYTPSPGTGELKTDPHFISGPMPTAICCPAPVNAYYLSQPYQSQCVDAGDDSDLPNCTVYNGTTSTDNLPDENQIDMGFHYNLYYTLEPSNTPTPTGTWSTSTPVPTNTPNPIAGEPSFDDVQYYTEADVAHVSVFDWDRNTDPSTQESFEVTITSTTDAVGITMTLTELDENSSYFASTITGKNLGFSLTGSDDVNEIIHVSDGDTVTIAYTDTQPVEVTYDYALWTIDSEPPTPTPSPATGTVNFDAGYYYTESSEAIITVIDADLNTNNWEREYVEVHVASDTDTIGISVTLYELGIGMDEFSTSPFWTNLTFSTSASDDTNEIIHVTDGDTITVTYTDANPSGDRTSTAIWIYASPTPSPTSTYTASPTATATPAPIPSTTPGGIIILLMIFGIFGLAVSVKPKGNKG